jgi:hypothetical protein
MYTSEQKGITENVKGCDVTYFSSIHRRGATGQQSSNLLLVLASTAILGFRTHHHIFVRSKIT